MPLWPPGCCEGCKKFFMAVIKKFPYLEKLISTVSILLEYHLETQSIVISKNEVNARMDQDSEDLEVLTVI